MLWVFRVHKGHRGIPVRSALRVCKAILVLSVRRDRKDSKVILVRQVQWVQAVRRGMMVRQAPKVCKVTLVP